jgi:hypothetical protein
MAAGQMGGVSCLRVEMNGKSFKTMAQKSLAYG